MTLITHNSLINEHSLAKLIAVGRRQISEDVETQLEIVKNWVEHIDALPVSIRKEQRLENSFLTSIVCNLLGHKQPGQAKKFSILPKDGNGQGIPDVKIGVFQVGEDFFNSSPRILLELKGPACLDFHKSQPSRTDKKSPAEQVVSDVFNEDAECEFGLVSNLVEFELFSRTFGTKRSISFSLREVKSRDDLALICAIFGPESPLIVHGSKFLEFKKAESNKQDLSKDFFTAFQQVRQKLLDKLGGHLEDKEVNAAATRILAQVVFVLFGETVGLLPRNSLKSLLEMEDYSWSVYLKFCAAIDKGACIKGIELFGYNGGLFAKSSITKLELPSEILQSLKPILNFEFRDKAGKILESSEVRDALGRVLEHALEVNEEERLYNFTKEGPFAEARKRQAAKNERQKKGVFYTPGFVTKYMVKRVCDLIEADGRNLSRTRWVDPACGSGAFLLEVFDYLRQYQMSKIGLRRSMLEKNKGYEKVLATLEAQVIGQLSGTDFDTLAVGIAQLNLSMKCSRPYEKLPVLAKTVTEADSLFEESTTKYDVVIGNPPYMQWRYIPNDYREWLAEDTQYKEFAASSTDYSVFFFKAAFRKLKPGGYLAFIATNKLLSASEGQVFRKWLLENFDIVELLDFREKVFRGTDIETCIYILRRKAAHCPVQLHYTDVFSFSKSDGHLEVLEKTQVPRNLTKQGPYLAIPTRTSPAMISVIRWFQQRSNDFLKLEALASIKAGMRVTDISASDVLTVRVRRPNLRQLQYEPLYDGASVQQGAMRASIPGRRVLRESARVQAWKRNLPPAGWFVLVKELSTRVAVAVIAGHCPAALNSLTLVFGTQGGERVARMLAGWLRHPLAEAWVDFWFGSNRTHANQRWKEAYLGQIPCPRDVLRGNLGIIPNWLVKESIMFLEGERRLPEPEKPKVAVGSNTLRSKVLAKAKKALAKAEAKSKRKPS